MASAPDVEKQLTSALNKAAEKLNLKKFTISLNINSQRGDGFTGEIFKASIIDEEKKTNIDVVLKKAPHIQRYRKENYIEYLYNNEILFYSEIYPALKEIEADHNVAHPFDSIPEYIASIDEVGNEIIVLRDITVEGYELREKDLLLNDEHANFIFKKYGHFHAMSFCLKEQKPELYKHLTSRCCDIFEKYVEKSGFCNILTRNVKDCFEFLDPNSDRDLREKFKKYVDQTIEIFSNSMRYKGKFSGLLHGDCWSNNMMFKYQDPYYSKLIDMKLVDFQVVKDGTPVYDLSYFFYTGGSKELFKNLEHYLDVYHQSFSEAAKKLGCDPDILLPRRILSEEWKTYSRYGMLLSIILTKIKLMTRNDSNYNKDLFKKRVRDILVHMNEIDAL